ncbi:MAG: TetR/AcrR family transcriptional regulator [Deltaproteobacteria bacterium]|nr:MAG: TetR/AcrR family transcriptional regulator [Deltaproteobacteria bacterium]
MKIPDKRGDVMQAALELISERGFHGAPMAEIAEKAGVAAGTIYRYFESKDLLITELHRELEDKIMAVLQGGYPSGRPLRERFLYLIRELLRYFMANPLHFRYMEQYFNSPYGISMHRDRLLGKSGNQDILMDIFEQGIERQVLKELPKAVLFSLAFGPLISLMRDHILGFIILDDTMIKQIAEACWGAIKR